MDRKLRVCIVTKIQISNYNPTGTSRIFVIIQSLPPVLLAGSSDNIPILLFKKRQV